MKFKDIEQYLPLTTLTGYASFYYNVKGYVITNRLGTAVLEDWGVKSSHNLN